MDPKKILENNLSLIDIIIRKITIKYNLQQTEFDDFKSTVYDRLVDNDYKILRNYKGSRIARSYLIMVIRNIFIDHYRKKSGVRVRSSTIAEQLGEPAITLERLLKYKGYTLDQAYEMFQTSYSNLRKTAPTRDSLEKIVTQLKIKPKVKLVLLDDYDSYNQLTVTETPGDVMVQQELLRNKKRVIEMIAHIRNKLNPEDKLIIKFRFVDDLSLSEIARRLKTTRYNAAMHLERILSSLKNELIKQGIKKEEMKELIENFDTLIALIIF
jgi:RNA polymerase sigma factor (sigma-70 family)